LTPPILKMHSPPGRLLEEIRYVSNVFKNINQIINIVIYIPDTT
jgi:hypothetical protein